MGTGAVGWSSKKQTLVALSSTEAEYVAASTAGQEMAWMRQLVGEPGFDTVPTSPLVLRMENQSALAVANNPEHHGRMKQVDVHRFCLHQTIHQKKIKAYYVPTTDMTADILTKALPRLLVECHRRSMGLM